jgi:hypothetical protein
VQPGQPSVLVPDTIAAAIELCLDSYEELAALGEEIEDEWQYVQDLTAAWQERLASVAADRGSDQLTDAAGGAVVRLSAEIASIADAHRAIDWLSTFPQAVLVALGERP